MVKISEMAAAAALDGTEKVPIVQGGVTVETSTADLALASVFVDGSDIYVPLTAAIAALGSAGGAIHIPAGTYTCSATISLTKPVHLTGDSGVGNIAVATKITFPADTTGIRVEYPFQGIGSRIEGLALVSSGGTTGHGIEMVATAAARDCQISSFPENGIELFGNVPDSNVNGFYLENIIIRECGGDGVHTQGGDGNAGIGIGIQIFDCQGWGINDDGFLGNVWISCQTDSNITGPYTTSQVSARSTYVGCYSEGNQNPSVFSQWSWIVGGLHAAGISGGTALVDGRITPYYILSTSLAGSDAVSVYYGLSGTAADVTAAGLQPIQLGFWNGISNTLEVRNAYLDASVAQAWTTDSCGYSDYASVAIAGGHTLFPRGIYLIDNNGKYHNKLAYSVAGAGQSALQFTSSDVQVTTLDINNTTGHIWRLMSTGSSAGVPNAFVIYDSGTAAHGLQVTNTDVSTNSASVFGWFPGAFAAALDAGIGRNAAGIVEINTGTAGTLATLKAKRLLTPLTSGLTIATGVITVTGGYHTVDTEAAAASDDLDTISGGTDGARLVIRAVNSARTVVVKDGTGNVQCAGDFSLDNAQDTIEFIFDGALSVWLELGRSDNGA